MQGQVFRLGRGGKEPILFCRLCHVPIRDNVTCALRAIQTASSFCTIRLRYKSLFSKATSENSSFGLNSLLIIDILSDKLFFSRLPGVRVCFEYF